MKPFHSANQVDHVIYNMQHAPTIQFHHQHAKLPAKIITVFQQIGLQIKKNTGISL